MATDDWTFDEYYLWGNTYTAADGDSQSPVDISSINMKECNLMCQLKYNYKNMPCKVQFDTHKRVLLNCEAGSYLNFNNRNYPLTEMSIHIPSLHSIDGEKYDAEILLIHKTDQSGNPDSVDNGIIVSRMLKKVSSNYGSINDFLTQFIYQIPKDPIDYFKSVNVNDWGPNMIVNQDKKSFYMYNGSLPFPPCNEKYHVIVYEDVGEISETYYNIFKNNLGSNIRPVRELGIREIFYNSGNDVTTQASSNDMVTSDKFLKCSIRDSFEEKLPKTEVVEVSEDTIYKPKDVRMSKNSVHIVKLVFLLITVLLLGIIAYFTVVYMYKQFYMQRLLASFVPTDVLDDVRVDNWKRCSLKTGLFKVADKPPA